MDIAYFAPASPPPTRQDLIDRKKEDFWDWLKKSQQQEDDHSINLDKAIPGFASVLAIIVFLIKEFIISESSEVFTEFAFTIGLEVFNIAIIMIILLRSLKIATDIKIEDVAINKQYIFSLERQFVKNVKFFFAMTLCLYVGLIFNTTLSKNVVNTNKTGVFDKIQSGRREIVSGIRELRAITLSDSDKPVTDSTKQMIAIMVQLGVMREFLQQILYNDSVRLPKNNAVLNNLQKINLADMELADSILSLQDVLKLRDTGKTAKAPDTEKAWAVNLMYHGAQTIRMYSEPYGKEDNGILISHILTLLASNIGALFLIYSFFVLHNKTIDLDGAGIYNKSLLALSHTFGGNIEEDKQDPRKICKSLIVTLILITTAHIILESNFKNDSEDINTLFAMLSGLCNALALSLLVARFESSLLLPTFNVLVILYTYAIIQVLFGVFNMPLFKYPHLIEDITILIAFIGKCFLYLYVLWLLRTDRLKYYFYHKYDNSSATREKLSWDEFLEKITPAEADTPSQPSTRSAGFVSDIDPISA